MEQHALDFEAARRARDTGAQRAADHADRETPLWSEQAYTFLLAWIISHGDFLTEQVVASAHGHVPDPPDGRAWGAVIQRAHRAGMIEKVGYAAAATSNCSPKVLWRVAARIK